MQEAIIQSIDERLSREGVHSGFLLLHSDSLNLHLELVRSDTSQNGSLMAETPFYTASITKPFTAALVMVLAEQGLLKIDEHITEYLPETMLDSLHMLDGTDYTDRIRVQHLLNHTSGLADYFGDDPISDVNMLAHVLQQPNRFWRPEELIDFTKQRFRPHFPPGEGFHYSDTGYVLLGLIAEGVTGKDLQELYTEIIFDPLQMDHSFINLRSEPADESTPKMAQVYAGPYNIGGLRSLSADWAGGGLVSTLGDLLRFQTAFHDGSLLKKSSSNAMKQWTTESSETTYGFGLRKWETGMSAPEAGEITFIGHTGATGSFMYYSPELDLHLIGTFNQTEESRSIHDFLTRVVQIVLKK
jgi:CubicO group peptidase (beta-lactamase class C family)